jgi:hypothetical protein
MILKWIELLRRNLKTLRKVFITYLICLVVYDILLSRKDAHYLIDKIYAFWSIFGIIGCFLLIKIAKGVAHLFLSKNEDYYG